MPGDLCLNGSGASRGAVRCAFDGVAGTMDYGVFSEARGSMSSGEQTATSFYTAVGGDETFRRIVAAFYREVATDEVLRPLYPEEDLGPAERRLRMFLAQYWGGPRTYSEERGHPRLRMRHMPFRIGPVERDAWLRCMRIAVAEIEPDVLDDAHRAALLDYLEMAANSLLNAEW